ncbi:MAG: exonuclease SbcCD subunit D C-terminal domain-containing protein [Pseudomonadota bacterium]|nr:exonuclease SbcCD subunit D C-terminal domain-containing protein [Pseudomonadota bacterium]
MRIIHTADWHLGHELHGIDRNFEHRRFLDWLLETLAAREADALIVCGDVFDSANPPAVAQLLLYRFLADLRARLPRVQTVIIAGNHDSPARLEAPRALLKLIDCHVVGTLPRINGGLDLERLLIPLRDRDERIAAWCAAVPFLRPADLPPVAADDDHDPLIEGVRRLYGQVAAAARARRRPRQALVATGHCYMTGTRLSELSERKILGGNQHALPADLFADDIGYTALGHLHLAQAVGNRAGVRYSGSPLPLSLTERRYPHQIVQIDLHGDDHVDVEAIPAPRTVEVLRLPEAGSATLAELLPQLQGLRADPGKPARQWPFLEVAVRLERPEPGLRRQLDEALEGRPVRLLKITTDYAGDNAPLADALPAGDLKELDPEEVFRLRHRQVHGSDPAAGLTAAFHQLLAAVQEETP